MLENAAPTKKSFSPPCHFKTQVPPDYGYVFEILLSEEIIQSANVVSCFDEMRRFLNGIWHNKQAEDPVKIRHQFSDRGNSPPLKKLFATAMNRLNELTK